MKISDPQDKGIIYPIKDFVRDTWQNAENKRKYLIYGTIFRILSDIASLYPAYGISLIITKLTTNTATKENVLLILVFCFIAYTFRYSLIFLAKKIFTMLLM